MNGDAPKLIKSATFILSFTPQAKSNLPFTPRETDDPVLGKVRIQGPGIDITLDPKKVRFHLDGRGIVLIHGQPRIGESNSPISANELADLLAKEPTAASVPLRGAFLVIRLDAALQQISAWSDRFAINPFCYCLHDETFYGSDRADQVAAATHAKINSQSIYDYVYHHVVPAPRTIFSDILRLEAAQRLDFDADGVALHRTWKPCFGFRGGKIEEYKHRFREILELAVLRATEGETRVGTFLSGGTDSSVLIGLSHTPTRCSGL